MDSKWMFILPSAIKCYLCVQSAAGLNSHCSIRGTTIPWFHRVSSSFIMEIILQESLTGITKKRYCFTTRSCLRCCVSLYRCQVPYNCCPQGPANSHCHKRPLLAAKDSTMSCTQLQTELPWEHGGAEPHRTAKYRFLPIKWWTNAVKMYQFRVNLKPVTGCSIFSWNMLKLHFTKTILKAKRLEDCRSLQEHFPCKLTALPWLTQVVGEPQMKNTRLIKMVNLLSFMMLLKLECIQKNKSSLTCLALTKIFKMFYWQSSVVVLFVCFFASHHLIIFSPRIDDRSQSTGRGKERPRPLTWGSWVSHTLAGQWLVDSFNWLSQSKHCFLSLSPLNFWKHRTCQCKGPHWFETYFQMVETPSITRAPRCRGVSQTMRFENLTSEEKKCRQCFGTRGG